jgi:CBS domain containing-hemolysin-like protein
MDDALMLALKILAVFVLVGLNGFFVAAEFGLVKVRDTQLSLLADQGNRRAKTARNIIKHLDAYLSAAQLGITLASLGLGWIGEPVFAALLDPVFGWLNIDREQMVFGFHLREGLAFAVGFSVITFLHISAGEQAPKWLAIQKPLPTSMWIAYPLHWFYKVSFPFVILLNSFSQWILRQAGLEPVGEEGGPHSEEELRMLLGTSHLRGGGDFGRALALNAMDLHHRIARDVMRPRREISFFDTTASVDECVALAERTRYSRFPLCLDGDIDRTAGLVHIKDLYALRTSAASASDLQRVARKLVFVPETAHLQNLLRLLLERKLHVAFVVDEYGSTVGMVTLENILEELVGQIQDEFDQETPLCTRKGDEVWELDGMLPLHELETLTGQTLREEGISTVGGFVTGRLGGFPREGDTLSLAQYELRVIGMDGMRVASLRLSKKVP